MQSYLTHFSWMSRNKWLLLLSGIVLLLIISPVSEIYERRDDVITPITAVVLLGVTYGIVEKRSVVLMMFALIFSWFLISILTEGSGLFAGTSIVAPILFLLVLLGMLVLLARWLVRAVYIDREVLCAAVCGYLLLGVIWAGVYRAITIAAPHALISADTGDVPNINDLLYFSYTTLTTTGFGDYLPKDPVVRMLTVMEAVVGTFYNTIIVARFVGLYGVKPSIASELNQSGRDE